MKQSLKMFPMGPLKDLYEKAFYLRHQMQCMRGLLLAEIEEEEDHLDFMRKVSETVKQAVAVGSKKKKEWFARRSVDKSLKIDTSAVDLRDLDQSRRKNGPLLYTQRMSETWNKSPRTGESFEQLRQHSQKFGGRINSNPQLQRVANKSFLQLDKRKEATRLDHSTSVGQWRRPNTVRESLSNKREGDSRDYQQAIPIIQNFNTYSQPFVAAPADDSRLLGVTTHTPQYPSPMEGSPVIRKIVSDSRFIRVAQTAVVAPKKPGVVRFEPKEKSNGQAPSTREKKVMTTDKLLEKLKSSSRIEQWRKDK